MKIFFSLIFMFSFCVFAENLLPNPQFISKNGCFPDQWLASDRFPRQNARVIPGEHSSNTFEISDDAAAYSYALSATVNLDPYKSYEFSIERKVENAHNAAIYYYWITRDGKRSKERFIGKTSGTSDWQTVKSTLTAVDAANTKGLRICLAVYPDKSGKIKGRTFFRNPSLRILSAEEAEKTKTVHSGKSAAPKELSLLSFPAKLTARPPGREMLAGRGQVEFLDLTTNHDYSRPTRITLMLPQGVENELYMMKSGRSVCDLVKPVSVEQSGKNAIYRFDLDSSYNYYCLGNGFFFETTSDTPERFDISVQIASPDGKTLAEMNAPVRLIDAVKEDCSGIGKFECFSWFLYPIQRIELENPAHKLPPKLAERWRKSGFAMRRATPLHAFPFTLSAYIDGTIEGLMPAVEVGGGKSRLTCPSSALRAGSNSLAEWFRRKKQDKVFGKKDFWGVFDYEPYCYSWTTGVCFCPECRRAFMNANGLTGNILEPKDILNRYQKQWTAFVCRQRAEVVKLIYDAIRQINPQARVSFCSMPQPGYDEDQDLYFQEYGIDAPLYDGFVDSHCPMNYDTTMRFFTRLESTHMQVRKPHIPILSTGWGPATDFDPDRYKLQLTAAGLLGCPGIYAYRGLIAMQGDWMNAQRRALSALKKLTPYRSASNIYHPEKEAFYRNGYAADGNLYVIVKKLDGNTGIFLFNNHRHETVYAAVRPDSTVSRTIRNLLDGSVCSPDGSRREYIPDELRQGVMVRVPPLTMLPLEVTAQKYTAAPISLNTGVIACEEAELRKTEESRFSPQTRNGMSTGLKTVNGRACFALFTPTQELLVDMSAGAVAAWQVNGKPAVDRIGNDSFIKPSPLWLNQQPVELGKCEIGTDSVTVAFRFKISDVRYAGLVVEKCYTLYRDKPVVEAKVNVLPQGGYRPFTYRVNLLLGIGRAQSPQPYATHIGYRIPVQGKLQDFNEPPAQGVYQRCFAKAGRQSHFSKEPPESFDGEYWIARNKITGESIIAEIGNQPVELFAWIRNSTATMEWVYPPAYPDNDPHKVADWSLSYRLQYKEGNK